MPSSGRSNERKVSETLCAPNLVQSVITTSVEKTPKVSLPPPVQFRDPPKRPDQPNQPETNGDRLIGSSESNRVRREKLERKLSASAAPKVIRAEVSDPAVYESPAPRNGTFGNGDISRNQLMPDVPDDECSTIPLRKKTKPIPDDPSSASLSRLDSKRGPQHYSPAVYVSPTSQRKRCLSKLLTSINNSSALEE